MRQNKGPSPDAQTLARAAEPIDDTLLQAEPDWLMDIACCCPSRPAVRVVVPASDDRPRPAELLLCGHHFRVSQEALIRSQASVYDRSGSLISSGARVS
jgi:hypothetical protein